jgi:hypothetical protein
MVLGMASADIQVKRVLHRAPEASELVCQEVAPAVVARIEAGLTIPGGRLRWVRAVHANRDGWLGLLAADVQGAPRHAGESDIAVWRLKTRGDPRTGEGAPEAAIATVAAGDARHARDDDTLAAANELTRWMSHFPPLYTIDSRLDLVDAAEACVAPAAPTAPVAPIEPELVCDPVAPAVVARIEARLTVPGTRLRGARAVRSAPYLQLWVVAADLEGVSRCEGDDDIGVWTVRWEDATPPGTPEALASVAAVNRLAAQAGPFPRSAAERRLVAAAVGCADEALGRG